MAARYTNGSQLLFRVRHMTFPFADRPTRVETRARPGWQVMAWEYTKAILLGAAGKLLGAHHSDGDEEGLCHEDSRVPILACKKGRRGKAKAKAKVKAARRERDRRRRRRRGRNKG